MSDDAFVVVLPFAWAAVGAICGVCIECRRKIDNYERAMLLPFWPLWLWGAVWSHRR